MQIKEQSSEHGTKPAVSSTVPDEQEGGGGVSFIALYNTFFPRLRQVFNLNENLWCNFSITMIR